MKARAKQVEITTSAGQYLLPGGLKKMIALVNAEDGLRARFTVSRVRNGR